MNWISVEARLPEKDKAVLVYCDPYIQVAEYWYDEGNVHVFMDPPHPPFENVTHWMPLPEPPKHESVDNIAKEAIKKACEPGGLYDQCLDHWSKAEIDRQ